MRATLESLLEDQADFASMSKWIHCGNSYSKTCGSIECIEESRESPIGLESASSSVCASSHLAASAWQMCFANATQGYT